MPSGFQQALDARMQAAAPSFLAPILNVNTLLIGGAGLAALLFWWMQWTNIALGVVGLAAIAFLYLNYVAK